MRIDDFPTGIRPILEDFEKLYWILNEFENNKIFFILGIVPSILTQSMIDRLKNYKYMIPACHGYNHKYNELSQVLIEKKDIYNEHTCMQQFDEFHDKSKTEILCDLTKAKHILQELGPNFIYMPPCNRINDNTIQALKDLDCKCILSEGSYAIDTIPVIKSDIYGKIKDLRENDTNKKVYTFHVTWEYDELFRRKSISIDEWREKLQLLTR